MVHRTRNCRHLSVRCMCRYVYMSMPTYDTQACVANNVHVDVRCRGQLPSLAERYRLPNRPPARNAFGVFFGRRRSQVEGRTSCRRHVRNPPRGNSTAPSGSIGPRKALRFPRRPTTSLQLHEANSKIDPTSDAYRQSCTSAPLFLPKRPCQHTGFKSKPIL